MKGEAVGIYGIFDNYFNHTEISRCSQLVLVVSTISRNSGYQYLYYCLDDLVAILRKA